MPTTIPANFTAIDFETASSARTSACALGIAVVQNYVIVEKKSWLINPRCDFHYYNTKIHGITAQMVEDQPDFATIWLEISPYIANRTLAAHNLPFDKGVLLKCMSHYAIPVVPFTGFCTCSAARRLFPSLPSHKLNELAVSLQLGAFSHHDALEDACMCARLAIHLAQTELQRTTVG